MASDLPIDGDGACMKCKTKPPAAESLTCHTCATPWHVQCLAAPPKDYDSAATWLCPDCSPIAGDGAPVNGGRGGEAVGGGSGGLVAAVRAIEADETLTEKEKAVKRQELMSGKKGEEEVKEVVDERLMCLFCREVLDRPVTAPCGHNFCLKCFQKWVCLEKRAKVCVKCRAPIPKSMASQPRINSALVVAIRMAKTAKPASLTTPTPAYHFIGNENRPEAAFRTERAKKAGKANACCGQIFVTIAPDHFGPILAEHDPKRNKGVLVGESWEDRMEVRQWGVHFPHVAGIAGQSNHGAQSVALSGGYEDDEDHGEWFLYTGSGGRDLSGNKRTNKDHSSHQTFEKYNEALRVSCKRGYPVRVVRSHKEKRSAYAPETGVRYDGIYRIEKCWRKVARQGFKVCRYLFVRCDNEPAPWASDEQGDRPRPLPVIEELKEATDVTVRKESPAWDYDEGHGWKWMKSPPQSKRHLTTDKTGERKRGRKHAPSTGKEKLLKEFSCLICRKVMTFPLTTPCAHNFCKLCLLEAYADQSFIRERTRGGRTLRAQKVVKKCPSCPNDISDFLQNPQVNRDLMEVIESLQKKIEEENAREEEDVEESSDGGSDVVEKTGDESDAVEGQKSSNDDADIVAEELNEEGSDGNGMEVEEKKIESTNGDSEVHAANSETEENGGDCQSPVKKQGSRKRKQTVGRKRAGKKTKKSGEASNDVEVSNEELKDTVENSIVKEDGSEGGDGKRENQAWANASASLSPSTQNRRVTRQSKVHS